MLLASTACAAQVSLIYKKHQPDAVTSDVLYYIIRIFFFFVRDTLNFFHQNQAVSRFDGIPRQFIGLQYGFFCSMKTLRHIPQTVSRLYKVTDNTRHGFHFFCVHRMNLSLQDYLS